MRTQPKLFHLLRTALSAECKVDEDMDSASRVVRGHAVSVGADSKRKAVKIYNSLFVCLEVNVRRYQQFLRTLLDYICVCSNKVDLPSSNCVL